jgi:Restriction Enzyme Adenine Methylase Associated
MSEPSPPRPADSARRDSLRSTLLEVRQRIEQHRGENIGEQNTKLSLINPVLRALGWDVESLDDVHHEYRRTRGDNPVDYALMLARAPRLFVEAKALDEDPDDRRWRNQIITYATVAGVEWVALTNGDEYRIYNAHALAPVEDKLFRQVKVSDDLQAAEDALLLLTKEQIEGNTLTALWREYNIDSKVRTAVESLFSPEPSPWLIRRLANELDGITPGEVRSALGRARVRLDFAAEETPPPPLPPPPPPSKVETKRQQKRRPTPENVSAVTLRQLIEARFINPPIELTTTYKGRELSGRVERDGGVSFGGTRYNSASTAAGMARASVVGAPAGRKYPQTNGWTFWRFRDADGSLRELNVLRERFASAPKS